jgi:hypothetical protein
VDAKETREEERRELRPYRRFVRIVFFLALSVMCVLVLRGIIRSLDRLPSGGVAANGPVDVRALRACAEDLERLEKRLRNAAADLLAREPNQSEPWRAFIESYEVERLTIVARCNLEDSSNDPVVRDLRAASSAIEELARSYALVYERHLEHGLPRAREATEALRRVNEALRTRR